MPDQTQMPLSQSLFSVMSCPVGALFPSLQTMTLYSFSFSQGDSADTALYWWMC